ncbi:MAG: hypothetical protein ACKVVP_23545 [Chloroflexota bacterium]
MPTWANRVVFMLAMLVPIVVGLWLYSFVFAAPLGGRGAAPPLAPTPVASPAILAVPTGTAPPTLSPAPETFRTGKPEPTLIVTPTVIPSVAQSTPEVVASPSLTPTNAPVRPTAAPPSDSSSPSSTALDPVETVREFYRRIDQGELQAAAELWTLGMRERFPTDLNIRQRFAATRSIRVDRATLVSSDAAPGQVTVAVEILETLGTPPSTQRFSGTWKLVRGASGWLLDQPMLERQ